MKPSTAITSQFLEHCPSFRAETCVACHRRKDLLWGLGVRVRLAEGQLYMATRQKPKIWTPHNRFVIPQHPRGSRGPLAEKPPRWLVGSMSAWDLEPECVHGSVKSCVSLGCAATLNLMKEAVQDLGWEVSMVCSLQGSIELCRQ